MFLGTRVLMGAASAAALPAATSALSEWVPAAQKASATTRVYAAFNLGSVVVRPPSPALAAPRCVGSTPPSGVYTRAIPDPQCASPGIVKSIATSSLPATDARRFGFQALLLTPVFVTMAGYQSAFTFFGLLGMATAVGGLFTFRKEVLGAPTFRTATTQQSPCICT
jgi:hypothetical protein